MSTLAPNVYGTLAAGSLDAAVGAAWFVQRGFANPGFLRNGAGDYTLTLQDGANLQTEAIVKCGLGGAIGNSMVAVEVLTTTTMRVRSFTSGGAGADVAADIDFWIEVQKIAP